MRRLWIVTLFAAIALLLISCGGNGGGSGGGSTRSTLTNVMACDSAQSASCHSLLVTQSDGTTVDRYYVLHVPANFAANSGALIVSLHGTSGSGLSQEAGTEMDETADQDGFAVAYPDAELAPGDGSLREWNSYFLLPFWPGNAAPDDVAFLRQLITALQASLNPDPRKIYVTGFSSGGFMSIRAGVEISDLVAAIGPVSGTLDGQPSGYNGSVPTPVGTPSVIMLHGDQDANVNYCGGISPNDPNLNDASQETTFNYWAMANACAMFDTTAPLCNGASITAVTEKDATQCASNSEVKFYRLTGGDHTTAFGNINLSSYNSYLNATTGVFTNDILWKFFAAHPKQ